VGPVVSGLEKNTGVEPPYPQSLVLSFAVPRFVPGILKRVALTLLVLFLKNIVCGSS